MAEASRTLSSTVQSVAISFRRGGMGVEQGGVQVGGGEFVGQLNERR